ncbi:MAG: Z1 domain-containing protein [Gammaproteobacteria bacterium]
MTPNRVEIEKNFTSALTSALSILPEPPTREEVEYIAEGLAELMGFDGDLTAVIEVVMIAIDTRMGIGVSLVDVEAKHDEEWVLKRDDIVWTYSEAYEAYLKGEGWHPTVVRSLGDVSKRILGHLQDPDSEGTSWDRRGLVIGHVQSGKTANYMGLIARAADVGYKFIIVIAGIHNNLRKQTQERIDEGFVGRSSDPENRVPVGVGLTHGYPNPATLTNIHTDFNKRTAEQSGWRLNDLNKPTILVIKKNVRTLVALHRWLREMNAQGDDRIADVPMLMIDDEADNASINTNKPDLDPTRTNEMLRKILGLFAKSSYVGYTATPFANIFINPDSYAEEVKEELFPRDFIYCLDAPNTYFGPEKVFLSEDESARIVEPIFDSEELLPFSHKKDHEVHELPPSLYRAINEFVVVRAIRNARGQGNRHCSMMVNVTRFVGIQSRVRDFISLYINHLGNAVKANYAMPEAKALKNTYMAALRQEYDEQFADCDVQWPRVQQELHAACESIRLFVVNSKTDEVLDYRRYERHGQGLTAIAVGGLSLSRGLTMEGLCVSYMYRNTRMYDTLMQMGRWFGYRPGYEDLCRVHLSPDSIDWYAHIADASEELRQQIKRMGRDGLSPKQFGLYVMAHPDRLLITAANKMREGQQVKVRLNFSGKLRESYILPKDEAINAANEELIAEYWRSGFGGKLERTTKGWTAQDVPIGTIEEFLTKFRASADFAEQKSAVIEYLRRISEKYPLGDVLLISVGKNGEDESSFRLGSQERASARSEGSAWRASKDRVASRGDEKLGLTDAQQQEAELLAQSDEKAKKPSDFHYRSVRRKPLLMLHVLGPVGAADPANRVPAFGVSFPPGDYETEIEVVANTIWMERMMGASDDSPDEEEDYDD